MAEDIQVVEAEPAEEVVKTEATKQEVKLDPNKSLSSQTKTLEKLLPEEVKEDEPADSKEAVEEVVKDEVATEEAEDAKEQPEEDESEVEPAIVAAPEGTWQEYVLKNLPSFKVNILDANGKPKTLNVKTPQDMPEGYSWPNASAQDSFHLALKAQDDQANRLVQEFNQKQQQAQYQEFKNQEAVDIQADITKLQREGVLDKFKYSEDDPKFNDDPAVKIANAIYDVYEKTNAQYLKEGRTYRITYADAADKYFATQSRQKPSVKPEVKAERERVATTVSASKGADPNQVKKTLPPGASFQDVLKLYKMGRI
jgi:hypothetical protein